MHRDITSFDTGNEFVSTEYSEYIYELRKERKQVLCINSMFEDFLSFWFTKAHAIMEVWGLLFLITLHIWCHFTKPHSISQVTSPSHSTWKWSGIKESVVKKFSQM